MCVCVCVRARVCNTMLCSIKFILCSWLDCLHCQMHHYLLQLLCSNLKRISLTLQLNHDRGVHPKQTEKQTKKKTTTRKHKENISFKSFLEHRTSFTRSDGGLRRVTQYLFSGKVHGTTEHNQLNCRMHDKLIIVIWYMMRIESATKKKRKKRGRGWWGSQTPFSI